MLLSFARINRNKTCFKAPSCLLQELRGEYVRHFLSGEFVMDRRKEAQLCKTMLTKIGKEDGHAFKDLAKTCCSTHSMVVKTVSHRRCRLSFLFPCPIALHALNHHRAVRAW